MAMHCQDPDLEQVQTEVNLPTKTRKRARITQAEEEGTTVCTGNMSRDVKRLKEMEMPTPQPGQHECEFSPEGEAGLHSKYRICAKNPGHTSFTPINKFEVGRLPPHYRNRDVYKWIRNIADLTVRISVRHTSNNRPDVYPNHGDGSPFANTPFPFADMRGSGNLRVGTGYVRAIEEMNYKPNKRLGALSNKPEHFCPCSRCKVSNKPSTRWWKVSIQTAAHVVCDTEEAQHTTCDLWYDSEDNLDRVHKLDGLKVATCDLAGDRCWFDCVTCDGEVATKLKKMINHRDDLLEKMRARYSQLYPGSDHTGGVISPNPLTVIVSHPHGCAKQVSVGETTDIHKVVVDFILWSHCTYTTPTCPGSSGAHVWVLGENTKWSQYWPHHPHSCACVQPGLNMSGAGRWSPLSLGVLKYFL